uniref:Uncharacterized protein n=1 Tax=Onchocerca volvulus TaxID=6282 RepID=A0A8R1XVU7_ONCVO
MTEEKFDLVNYELSKNLRRSISLNDEDLPKMGYCNDTVTASTSFSTTSVPQNSVQSSLRIQNCVPQSISCHEQNGKNKCKIF